MDNVIGGALKLKKPIGGISKCVFSFSAAPITPGLRRQGAKRLRAPRPLRAPRVFAPCPSVCRGICGVCRGGVGSSAGQARAAAVLRAQLQSPLARPRTRIRSWAWAAHERFRPRHRAAERRVPAAVRA